MGVLINFIIYTTVIFFFLNNKYKWGIKIYGEK